MSNILRRSSRRSSRCLARGIRQCVSQNRHHGGIFIQFPGIGLIEPIRGRLVVVEIEAAVLRRELFIEMLVEEQDDRRMLGGFCAHLDHNSWRW